MYNTKRGFLFGILAAGIVIGFVVGAIVFPITVTETVVETKYIEKPVEVIKYVEVEKQNDASATKSGNSLGMFEITAYCSCKKCCGVWAENRPKDENGNDIVYTASGAIARPNHTIAVDPSVIPFGTQIVINGITYTAEDTGGAIKGNRLDIYFDSHEAALQWGRQTHEVFASQ